MAIEPQGRGGLWRRLTRPSMHWSVLTLLIIGIIVGGAATVGTVVMVEATGTDELMVVSAIYDHAARVRSYEILAEVA